MAFVKAERKRAKLRLGIMGPSGSGKTYGALQIAKGLGGSVFFIDTERGSASLYSHLLDFQVCELENDFSPQAYTKAIHEAEAAGASVIVIDSLSHAWEGQGGALDMVEAATARQKSGNSYTAWREVTPHHRALVDAMLQSPAHIIMCLRVKTEYTLEDVNGRKVPKKIGLAPIQRAGIEYESTTFFEVDDSHHAVTTKDRTGMFDSKRFQLSDKVGADLKAWLDSGKAIEPKPAPMPSPAPANAKEATADELHAATEAAAKLHQARDIEELRIAWTLVPANLRPSLESLKNQIKDSFLKEGK